jgi:hypothetical protein
MIVFGAAFLALAAWTGSKILRVHREQAVLANGVPASDLKVSGYQADITSLFINRMPVPPAHSGGLWPDYVLNIEYTDAKGIVHQSEREFGGPFGYVDEGADIQLRYDPQHPDDYALSWAVAVGGSETAGSILEFLILGFIAFVFVAAGWAVSQEFYDARRAAEDGEEVELQIVSAKEQFANGQPTGMVVYSYLVPREKKVRKRSLDKKKPPLMLDEGGHFMLGIRSHRNSGRIIPVLQDLSPFAFAAEEEKEIRGRLASHVVASGSV